MEGWTGHYRRAERRDGEGTTAHERPGGTERAPHEGRRSGRQRSRQGGGEEEGEEGGGDRGDSGRPGQEGEEDVCQRPLPSDPCRDLQDPVQPRRYIQA